MRTKKHNQDESGNEGRSADPDADKRVISTQRIETTDTTGIPVKED